VHAGFANGLRDFGIVVVARNAAGIDSRCGDKCLAQVRCLAIITLLKSCPASRVGFTCQQVLFEALRASKRIGFLEQLHDCLITQLECAVTVRVKLSDEQAEIATVARYGQAIGHSLYQLLATLFVARV